MIRESLEKMIEVLSASGGPTLSTTYAFVLKNGFEFQNDLFPDEYKQGPRRDCFNNARGLALHTDLVYVEGFACLPDLSFPVHHAWCVKCGTRNVVDPTPSELTYYLGVPFTRKTILYHDLDYGGCASLLDDPYSSDPFEQMTKEALKEFVEYWDQLDANDQEKIQADE